MAVLSRTKRVPVQTPRERFRQTRVRLPLNDIRGRSELVNGATLRVRLSRIAGETPKHILAAPFGLPVILNGFSYDEEASHTEYDTIRHGEFSQPTGGTGYHGRKLKRMEAETLALDWDAPWLAHQGYSIEDVQSTLDAILHSKRPFHMGARIYGSDGPFELDMDATLRSIRPERKPGERDTRYFALSFVEWRDPSLRRRASGEAGKRRPSKVTIDANDTLNSISKSLFGDYSAADLIRRHNGLGSFGASTALVKHKKLKVGSVLKIPPTELRVKVKRLGAGAQGEEFI
ncbi:MAG: hypothetical protein LC798_13260 [Chloroflexi bacterium]|nr:hypothetical protein [Chloroflexota bacterium]